ncbi:MAG: hypothetical protein RR330_00300 [Alistipes sp.]
MKKILWIFILLSMFSSASVAQNILLGERVPEIKSEAWLQGQEPAAKPLTYIEFYHSKHKGSAASLAHLEQLARTFDTKLKIIVITNEKQANFEAQLTPYLTRNANFGVLTDGSKIFTAYGVNYLPFGVLVDAKNRALWMGNGAKLQAAQIENIPLQ